METRIKDEIIFYLSILKSILISLCLILLFCILISKYQTQDAELKAAGAHLEANTYAEACEFFKLETARFNYEAQKRAVKKALQMRGFTDAELLELEREFDADERELEKRLRGK